MTDLLQTAVNTGSGRAAQIGRPVAGKTGTTTSNKDGWFLGFSSGLTTGVWMGRDDARTIPGLQGGTAPARAFAAFMKVAVARRPVEQFETAVTLPDEDALFAEENYFGQPDNGLFVDENGGPVDTGEAPPPSDGSLVSPDGGPLEEDRPPADEPSRPPQGQQLNQAWLDRVLGRPSPPPPTGPGAPPQRVPPPDRSQESRPNQ